jgi:hypothetical protein
MTELWDIRNPDTQDGRYVGLRGKWISNIALPETHDSMAADWRGLDEAIAEAQDKLFGDQLLGGIRSFDMRYVFYRGDNPFWEGYVGSHFSAFPRSTMDGCVAALQKFFDASSGVDRCHEFIVLKIRYGTGQNNERPYHSDADAMMMLATFVDKLQASGLLDRVLNHEKDASGNHLASDQLPIATLEKLNVTANPPGFKNLLLTLIPDYLMPLMKTKYPAQAAYYWPNASLWFTEDPVRPYRPPYPGNLPPYFGMSTVGVDVSGGAFDHPQRDESKFFASVAVDAMLYDPGSDFLDGWNNHSRVIGSRNEYGSPYNYNCIAANYFEDTAFVNNVIQLNQFNDGVDVYHLGTTKVLKIALSGSLASVTLPDGIDTYFGSLQLADALQVALRKTSVSNAESFTVEYDGRFTIANRLANFSIIPNELSSALGFPATQQPAQNAITGKLVGPFKDWEPGLTVTTPWLANEYAGQIHVSHPSGQDNRVPQALPAGALSKLEVIYEGGYGIINLRLTDSSGNVIKPEKPNKDPKGKYGDNWVSYDFYYGTDIGLVSAGGAGGELIDGVQFAYQGGYGIVNVRVHIQGNDWGDWLISKKEQGQVFEFLTDEVVLSRGISWVGTWRENSRGLVDVRMSGIVPALTVTTPWLANEYSHSIRVDHPADQDNRVRQASLRLLGKLEVIYEGDHGIINLRLSDSKGNTIAPEKPNKDPQGKYGDNWVSYDFYYGTDIGLVSAGGTGGELIDGIQFAYQGQFGLVNVRVHIHGKDWGDWLISKKQQGQVFDCETDQVVLTDGISWVGTWRQDNYGLVDARLSGKIANEIDVGK